MASTSRKKKRTKAQPTSGDRFEAAVEVLRHGYLDVIRTRHSAALRMVENIASPDADRSRLAFSVMVATRELRDAGYIPAEAATTILAASAHVIATADLERYGADPDGQQFFTSFVVGTLATHGEMELAELARRNWPEYVRRWYAGRDWLAHRAAEGRA